MQKFINYIEKMDVMKFKEAIYYIIVLALVTTFLIVFLTKPELFQNKWIVVMVSSIIALILKQFYDWVRRIK